MFTGLRVCPADGRERAALCVISHGRHGYRRAVDLEGGAQGTGSVAASSATSAPSKLCLALDLGLRVRHCLITSTALHGRTVALVFVFGVWMTVQ